MVRTCGLVFVIGVAVACTAQVSPTVSPATSPSPAPASPTAAPSPSPAGDFRDDFDGALEDGWQWLGEDASGWNLTDAPGFLRIFVQPSSMGAEDPVNFAVRPAPIGDFVLETLMRFEPAQNYEFAGLLIYERQGRAMQFGRAFADGCGPRCIGNALYFDSLFDGAPANTNYATQIDSADTAYLRLARAGNLYSAYFSVDGTSWTLAGQHQSGVDPHYVGLIATQGPAGARAADFDYFMISRPAE